VSCKDSVVFHRSSLHNCMGLGGQRFDHLTSVLLMQFVVGKVHVEDGSQVG
jgi:hypothetical protein